MFKKKYGSFDDGFDPIEPSFKPEFEIPKPIEMPKFKMPELIKTQLYEPPEIDAPDLSYEPPKIDLPKPIEKRPSIEEMKWNTHLSDHSKAVLGANGVNPHNFKSEKERHDSLKSEFGKDDSSLGHSLDRAYGPDPLKLPSLDGMLDRGRADMAIMWDRAMDLGKKA